ncbi:tRNA (guanosine(37)-N1)-methyltransferase TrmD, partial [Candidatus Sumerlaeota bacterium]|nr:tRNA (guanosine(37)-N1)-methyltransferase TrmD [Candidatus Sumerlaeota bacterium]
MLQFDILTLFPGYFEGPFKESILMRAKEKGLIGINVINIRDYTTDSHHVTDDYPYGGGGGMVMKAEPIARAIKDLRETLPVPHMVYLTPQGALLDQRRILILSERKRIVLLCGHYEGIDERVRESYVDEEISIGNYVLTGGEGAAVVVVDAVSRMIPGVLGNESSFKNDSFYAGLLDFPQYTRPEIFEGKPVPETLLSGHHKKIEEWRRRQALERTLKLRPDLLESAPLTQEDRICLEELQK